MGARRNADGEWHWIDGEPVADNFWDDASFAGSDAGTDTMVRWIGSFRAMSPDNDRVIGYLCRWKR